VCVGGGCGLAIACDLRVAGPAARFGITPAKLGLAYSLHDTKLLVDLVGPAQAKRILFTGRLIDAAEAARIGLVDRLADDARRRGRRNSRRYRQCFALIASRPRRRLSAASSTARPTMTTGTLAQFGAAFEGEDFQEGVSAFLAKRPPRFRPR
jgi:enoyl-CoA hydratase/carnithine racemase